MNVIPTEYKILGGLGLAAALFFGIKSVLQKNPAKDTVRESQREVDKLAGKLTYSMTWYKQAADTLQSAMFDAGTNEDSIFRIFKQLKNGKDLYQLIAAFGVRPYRTFGVKQGDYNLSQWFNEELSSGETDTLNKILKSNKIAFQF